MKKFFGILLLIALMAFKTNVHAQVCPGVGSGMFSTDPNSLYSGVFVTLDRPYGQAVTVSGDIKASDPTVAPVGFSLTIAPGNLRAETIPSYYETTLGGYTYADITSVTPCPSDEIALNRVGELHNDYQESLLSYITSQNLPLSDTNQLKQVIQIKSNEFFQSKGIDISNYPFSITFRPTNNNILFSQSNYSNAGATILSQLQSLINYYDETNDAQFFISLNDLKQQALSLPNHTEVYTVGIPVTVAIYSFNYWKSNANRWSDILQQNNGSVPIPSPGGPSISKMYRRPCHLGLGQLGFADVTGGAYGAWGGVSFGPLGVIAGGVMGASTGSLGNIAGQLMGCLFDWW